MLKLLRALVAGGAATAVDLAVLVALVTGLGLSPRVANVPALLAGGAVSFVANRGWVFRARAGSLGRQLALFVVVEAVALALSGALYDVAVRALAAHAAWYLAVRLVTSHVVFVGWSFPLWRLVFRTPRDAAGAGA